MASNVLLSTASTKPSPSVLVVVRKVRMVSLPGTRSCACAQTARSFTNERLGTELPPLLIKMVGLTNLPKLSRCPTRSSLIWLMPPVTGFW